MIGIVCALRCEAEPVISYFGLKKWGERTPFPIYFNEAYGLVISGIGKLSAASATAYLHGLHPCEGWLNMGIAGHPSLPVGEAILAHQVIDRGSKETFYPTFGWKLKEKTAAVFTVDSPETRFEDEGVYEMEGAGFCKAAFRFTTAELVHLVKVISDNQKTAPSRDKNVVKNLIQNQLTLIEQTLEKMGALIKEVANPEIELDLFVNRWHFTQTQQHQLKRLLQRWEACFGQKELWTESLQRCKSAKEVIRTLERCFN